MQVGGRVTAVCRGEGGYIGLLDGQERPRVGPGLLEHRDKVHGVLSGPHMIRQWPMVDWFVTRAAEMTSEVVRGFMERLRS